MKKAVSDLRAIGFGILAFALWVCSDACMKLVGEAALPPYQVVAFMGIFGALIIGISATLRGDIKKLWPQKPQQQVGRAMLTVLCILLNAVALKYLPLTVFYVVAFTMPMMIALLASIFLKEQLTVGKILAIIIGFFGVMIAVDPLQNFAAGEWIGFLAAFGSACSGAISIVWLRRMTQSHSTLSIIFLTSVIETATCAPFLLGHVEPMTAEVLIILFLMALLTVGGNLGCVLALKYTTATNFAQFHYTQIITGALLGYLIWSDVPPLHLYIGAAIIISSGLYIANHARKAALPAS